MRMISYPLMPPAKCVECGYGGKDRRYADTGLDLEFYGVVYLCDSCLNSWCGLLKSDDMSKLRERNAELLNRIGELERERDTLLGTIRIIEHLDADAAGKPSVPDEEPAKVTIGAK